MTKKDAAVIKALAELGIREDPELSPEEELLLKRALDPEEDFYSNVEQVFKTLDSD